MCKTVIIDENRVLSLKEDLKGVGDGDVANTTAIEMTEARPEVDEYEIGDEGNNPPIGGNFYHVNESYNNSVRGDMKLIDYIDYVPHDNPREEGYTEEDITEFEPYYELECYGNNGDLIFCGDLTLNELFDYFPDKIIHALSERSGRKVSQSQWRIEDILSWDTTPKNINDVEEVNAIAKRIQTGGPSAYLLVDGDIISFHDHVYITIIDDMTPSKFVGLGNIRTSGEGIEIAKEPTREQIHVLKQLIRRQNKIYLDIVEDEGEMYPKTICSAFYSTANADRIVNDILHYFEDGIRPQGMMAYENKNRYKTLLENLDFEVNSSDINLSSFKKKTTLAPNIWDSDNTLNSMVRLRLLDIADDFWQFANLTWVKPSGIIITGSICNYNWSKYSDIDLHLIVDFKEIDEKTNFVRDYLDSKKNEWNDTHSDLKIYDFPIEVYVQDIDDELDASGIYDLEENKWVRKPNTSSIVNIGLNKFHIKNKTAEIMTIIDDMYDSLHKTNDNHDIESIGEDAKYLWKKVKNMRKRSLDKSGENGNGNIIYKCLRRSGYLEKLWKLSTIVYDKVKSITESVNAENNVEESIRKYSNVIALLKEEIVADGNSEHNPYAKRWKAERKALKDFICNFGKVMTSKENGKQYKVYYDKTISQLIGYNYCICLQWDPVTLTPGYTPYIRALDKFTDRTFQAQYDTRGMDNIRGTNDNKFRNYMTYE